MGLPRTTRNRWISVLSVLFLVLYYGMMVGEGLRMHAPAVNYAEQVQAPAVIANEGVPAWGAARMRARQPIHLLTYGLPASGELWLHNALVTILEEAELLFRPRGRERDKVARKTLSDGASSMAAACGDALYCVARAANFTPSMADEVRTPCHLTGLSA